MFRQKLESTPNVPSSNYASFCSQGGLERTPYRATTPPPAFLSSPSPHQAAPLTEMQWLYDYHRSVRTRPVSSAPEPQSSREQPRRSSSRFDQRFEIVKAKKMTPVTATWSWLALHLVGGVAGGWVEDGETWRRRRWWRRGRANESNYQALQALVPRVNSVRVWERNREEAGRRDFNRVIFIFDCTRSTCWTCMNAGMHTHISTPFGTFMSLLKDVWHCGRNNEWDVGETGVSHHFTP